MSFIETQDRKGARWVMLNRPERHNALVPDLLNDLRAAIAAAAQAEPIALVLTGNGPSFSTGGDIGGFLDHSETPQELLKYAERVVGALHDAVLDLLAFPAPVLAAVNGPVTGGSTGLMLAADMMVMAQSAFIQPYYCEVGFGPDGGWTALLAEQIGAAKALQIQYLNERISAQEAVGLGLARAAAPISDLPAQIDEWVEAIGARFAGTHQVTRANIWDETRRDLVRQRLDQEKARFFERIAQPETLKGMRDFTGKSA